MTPRFLQNIPVVTRNLLYLNVIMFVATLINEDFMIRTFAMFYPESPYFRWWQPVTHMFMHGGVWHILFNMYTLVMFGTVVERALGTRDYIIFYLVTGLGAVALHIGVQWLEINYRAEAWRPPSLPPWWVRPAPFTAFWWPSPCCIRRPASPSSFRP